MLDWHNFDGDELEDISNKYGEYNEFGKNTHYFEEVQLDWGNSKDWLSYNTI